MFNHWFKSSLSTFIFCFNHFLNTRTKKSTKFYWSFWKNLVFCFRDLLTFRNQEAALRYVKFGLSEKHRKKCAIFLILYLVNAKSMRIFFSKLLVFLRKFELYQHHLLFNLISTGLTLPTILSSLQGKRFIVLIFYPSTYLLSK